MRLDDRAVHDCAQRAPYSPVLSVFWRFARDRPSDYPPTCCYLLLSYRVEMSGKLSTRKGGRTKGAPAHQNTHAWKHNRKSKKTAYILALNHYVVSRECFLAPRVLFSLVVGCLWLSLWCGSRCWPLLIPCKVVSISLSVSLAHIVHSPVCLLSMSFLCRVFASGVTILSSGRSSIASTNL
jgi:hypothetical protein